MTAFGFNRTLLNITIGFFAVDLFAILMGMTMFDLVLRPFLLLLLIIQGAVWLRQGGARFSFLLILLGLLVAIPNEILQRYHGMSGSSISGTALYYGLFCLGFASLRITSFSWRIVIPFAGLAVYMICLFLLIAPALYRAAAIGYMFVTTLMLGFAFYPIIVDSRNPVARALALGGLLLLASDTIRALVFMRMGFYFGSFLVDNLLEAVIVSLFFAGHFFAVQVMKPGAMAFSPARS